MLEALLNSPVMVQFLITTGVVGSAWMTNRVWKNKKENDATKAKAELAPAVPARFDDPTTPVGAYISRLDNDLRTALAELVGAREQRAVDIAEKAQLRAENLALQEDKTELERRLLQTEARAAAHGY